MREILKTFWYGIIGIILMSFIVFLAVGGIWLTILMFTRVASTTGWAYVLNFITAIFDLAVSIAIIFLISNVLQSSLQPFRPEPLTA